MQTYTYSHYTNSTVPAPENIHHSTSSRSGVALLHVIMGIALFAILAAGMTMLVSTSSISTSYPICQKRARYIAESGVRFAMSNLRSSTDIAELENRISAMNGQSFSLDNGDGFQLVIIDNRPNFTVQSTSTTCKGEQLAQHTVQATFNVPVSESGIISFENSMADFTEEGEGVEGSGNPDDVISVNEEEKTASLGNKIKYSYGCLWYEGNISPCINGNCTLGAGLRAYFDLDFQEAEADGFTFAIKSMERNTLETCGGGYKMGEFLGYAGPGALGNGILPPKMGVEFDTYHNGGWSSNFCKAGTRRDRNSKNHLSAVYWGAKNSVCDDNVHGAGSGFPDEPQNPTNWLNDERGLDGYFYKSKKDWLEEGTQGDPVSRVRIEIHRATEADRNGNYLYTIMAWVRQADLSAPEGFSDTTKDLQIAPDMIDTVVLDQENHRLLEQIAFGWTQGTGLKTQIVNISNFELAFREENSSPQSVPTDFVAGWGINEGAHSLFYDDNATSNVGRTLSPTENLPERWVTGTPKPLNPAIYFDDSNLFELSDTIYVKDDPALDLRETGSISLWLYQTQKNKDAILVLKGNRLLGSVAYQLSIEKGKLNLKITRGNTPEATVSSRTPLERDKWLNVVATWTPWNLDIYLNGALDAREPNSQSVWAFNSSGRLSLGAGHKFDGMFNGIIDQVYLWDRALSPEEIFLIHKNGQYESQSFDKNSGKKKNQKELKTNPHAMDFFIIKK